MFDRELAEYSMLGLHDYGTDVKVSVYKIGGGTVGKAYVGDWGYLVETLDEREIIAGEDLRTPMPHTHKDVAALALDFAQTY